MCRRSFLHSHRLSHLPRPKAGPEWVFLDASLSSRHEQQRVTACERTALGIVILAPL